VSDPRDQLQADLAERDVIERELGRWGMATAYLAHDLLHDRPVALKVLHPQLALALGPDRRVDAAGTASASRRLGMVRGIGTPGEECRGEIV
jgi:hypothetical protein